MGTVRAEGQEFRKEYDNSNLRYVSLEKIQDGIGLFDLEAHDPTGELGVDEKGLQVTESQLRCLPEHQW